MIRGLSCHDYDRALRIVRWPFEETLAAYRAFLKQQALEEFRHSELTWSGLVANLKEPNKARPKPPPILREVYRGQS